MATRRSSYVSLEGENSTNVGTVGMFATEPVNGAVKLQIESLALAPLSNWWWRPQPFDAPFTPTGETADEVPVTQFAQRRILESVVAAERRVQENVPIERNDCVVELQPVYEAAVSVRIANSFLKLGKHVV